MSNKVMSSVHTTSNQASKLITNLYFNCNIYLCVVDEGFYMLYTFNLFKTCPIEYANEDEAR